MLEPWSRGAVEPLIIASAHKYGILDDDMLHGPAIVHAMTARRKYLRG